MGHSTNITIQNDYWHEIAANPQALVDAIIDGMSSGSADWRSHSPISETWDARQGRAPYPVHAPAGVTVHKAQHNDVPQVIINTYGSHAIAAHELPLAIRDGWLDLNQYNRRHAENIVKELRSLATAIQGSLDTVRITKEIS